MKIVAIISALLLAGVAVPPCIAKEPAQEVFLSAGDQTMTTSGETPGREARTYLLRMQSDLPIVFSVDADNSACSLEIMKASQRGVFSKISRFPASFRDSGQSGDEYRFSFFQNRVSFMSGARCAFSFSLTQK
ncbi:MULTISPECIES: hypothetical protein [Rhizobium]|jgi:hypothetical protein|uniref:hypothetical protein n=1 Tax=Rhizobium TaxID=379 RepID=UPI000645C266|nr:MULTISPECIES: hypothetical protein [Rhizobium]KZS54663.1 hypothetical protein AS890_20910 [Rhizobium anhuiense bv. trifolii]MBB3300849.1 hypothetical protein [Rhizobium sp. BK112]MBB3370101.1 hypothetical protein [Rhizobium sp. BK077]MBB3743450.1 hypothetical protein [Rhizobium sp. BK591]MBB4113936.1 hypothetical protein [Rhizobium sp. BK226]